MFTTDISIFYLTDCNLAPSSWLATAHRNKAFDNYGV